MSQQPRAYKSNVLPRGKACLTCRRRKMRCDGKRPACTQCVTGRRDRSCQYDEQRARSQAQLLADHVQVLEQRLHKLQYNDPVTFNKNPAPASENAFIVPISPADTIYTTFIDQPNPDLLGADLWCSTFEPPESAFDWTNPGSSLQLPPQVSTTPPVPSQLGTIPSEAAIASFISTFLDHQSGLGYLNLTLDMTSNYTPLRPPIFNAAALWGYRLQGGTDMALQKNLLSQVLNEIMSSLSSNELAHEVIIATSLVALYLYSSGRLLEGKYHADAAASLCVASGLHQLSSPLESLNSFNGPSVGPDRQRMFWNTFELGCWSIITGTHNPLLLHREIKTTTTTPWIVKFDSSGASLGSSTPFEDLLNEDAPMFFEEASLSIRAKSATLLQLSGRLSALLEEDPSNPEHHFEQSRLEQCIHKCSTSLGTLFPLPVHGTVDRDEVDRFYDLALAQSLLGAGMVLLHHSFAETQPGSLRKCQTWARKILHVAQLIDETQYEKLSPVIAICWAVAADVFLQELGVCDVTEPARTIHIEDELNTILRALKFLGITFPIAGVLGSRVGSRYFGDQSIWSIASPSPYLSPSPTSSQHSC